jgi:phosphate transport system substrate-binding protein
MKKKTGGFFSGGTKLVLAACIAAVFSVQMVSAQERETILRLHGSNTIGAQVAPALAEAYLKQLGANSVQQVETIPGVETLVEGHFPRTIKVIAIQAHGSSTAFKGLKEGLCDIGMSSRKIKADEGETLASLGNMTSNASEHVLALDGLAIIVNAANNSTNRMDFQTLADIFSGTITNWSQLGGPNAAIKIHARDEQSGTYDTFKSLVLGKKTLDPSAKRYESSEALSDAVNADAHAIGFIGLPYIKYNKALAISDGGPAIRPTVFTVASEDYPVSRRLYLYTPATPSNSHTQPFMALALGKLGQDIVRQNKFIDLGVSAEEVKVEVTGNTHNYQTLYKYLNAVRGAKRLSSSFRFKGETLELDNRAIRDLDRLLDYLMDNRVKEILLAGFSEDQGEYAKSLGLSCKRAEVLQEELLSRGIRASEVLCLGQELPLASNATEAGREKNRRVEIWVK